MRNTKHLLQVSIMATSFFFFYSCEKAVTASEQARAHQRSNGNTDDSRMMANSTTARVAGTFGEVGTFPLTAGQTIPAGTVEIENDANNLYVTYTTTDGWKLNEVHLKPEVYTGVILQPSSSSLAPGQFPYSQTFSPTLTNTSVCSTDGLPDTYTVTIPLSSLGSSTSYCIYAHAKISRCVSGTTQTETGWGGTIYRAKGKWYGSLVYDVQLDPGTTKGEDVGK